jgi:hypothetical protein
MARQTWLAAIRGFVGIGPVDLHERHGLCRGDPGGQRRQVSDLPDPCGSRGLAAVIVRPIAVTSTSAVSERDCTGSTERRHSAVIRNMKVTSPRPALKLWPTRWPCRIQSARGRATAAMSGRCCDIRPEMPLTKRIHSCLALECAILHLVRRQRLGPRPIVS